MVTDCVLKVDGVTADAITDLDDLADGTVLTVTDGRTTVTLVVHFRTSEA